MGVEGIDSSDSIADSFGEEELMFNPLNDAVWNGRDVQLSIEKHQRLALISQFYQKALQMQEEVQKGGMMSSARFNHELFPEQNKMLLLPDELTPILKTSSKHHRSSNESRYFTTDGVTREGMAITFINGMDNTFKEAFSSAEYLRTLGTDMRIEGIYNHTNGVVLDFLEVFGLNYLGYSPKTADLLVKKWTHFHKINKDNPHAKCLHICHSQGTLHTENALKALPKEIRNRIIVVSIAPAKVVPDKLCYRSYNYASKNDVVHYGEDLVMQLLVDHSVHDEDFRQKIIDKLHENKSELIFLEPHKDAEGLDHDINSPTYLKVIEKHIREYHSCNGKYR